MKNKILLVLCILFGLMFVNSGLNKFLQYMPMPEDMPTYMLDAFGAMMTIGWILPLVAIVEIVGGILFMVPKFRALGAIMIFPIMIGILLTHVVAGTGLPVALVLFAINMWVIIDSREKYMPMIK
ncbi:MAG: DoxX family membrane protein [Cryomorphaceae bacterium]|nr:DoxX family membrane protein [Cryomorphaceae bacterium]